MTQTERIRAICERRRKRCRWGLRVQWPDGRWIMTACRFDPDTPEAATACAEKGVRDGVIIAFELVDKFPNRNKTK